MLIFREVIPYLKFISQRKLFNFQEKTATSPLRYSPADADRHFEYHPLFAWNLQLDTTRYRRRICKIHI